MKADRIKVSMEFQTQGGNIWLTAEAAVALDENAIEEFKKTRSTITEAFIAITGQSDSLGWRQPLSQEPIPEVQVEKPIGFSIDSIIACDNIKDLESYKYVVRGNSELEEVYIIKHKELTNG